jgi:UrcA family protein
MVTRIAARTAIVVATAAASSVFIAAPASAQQGTIYVQAPAPPNLRIERVGYWDLNLATRAGERTLHRRVGGAVERVCLYDPHRWYGMSDPDYNQCRTGSWRRARPQIAAAVYQARAMAYYRGY